MDKSKDATLRAINHFAARVDIILHEKEMTRADLARALDITPQGLHRILTTGTPRFDTIHKIACALSVASADLLQEVTPDEYAALMPRIWLASMRRSSRLRPSNSACQPGFLAVTRNAW